MKRTVPVHPSPAAAYLAADNALANTAGLIANLPAAVVQPSPALAADVAALTAELTLLGYLPLPSASATAQQEKSPCPGI